MYKVPFVGISKQFKLLEQDILNSISAIGREGNFILGKNLSKFEKLFSHYCQSKYALGLNSGSDALFLGLKALGICKGDEIITTPHSFIATSWVIDAIGAKIIFCDVMSDGNINPNLIEDKITKKTKAILPIHWAGKPFDITDIRRICKKYKIHLIEDAAQAIGATFNKRKVGSFGVFAGFSLHPLKNLGVIGDGGMFVTNNYSLYKKVKLLRNHGLASRDKCKIWGFNSRLDEIQSAVGLLKISKIDNWNKRCNDIAEIYSRNLKNLVTIPEVENNKYCVFHNYIINTPKRNSLKLFLEKKGIEVKIHYPIPIHKQEAYTKNYPKILDLKFTEKLVKTSLSLPIYPELENKKVFFVIKSIKDFFSAKT